MFETELEGEQKEAFIAVCSHLLNNTTNDQIIKFGAFAGCGKTFVIRSVMKFLKTQSLLDPIIVIALTGRAVSQISRAGVPAQTCHSLLYKPIFDGNGNLTGWTDAPTSEILAQCSGGIIIDEGSMIPKKMYERLKSLGVPLVITGDFAQLPPVDPENKDNDAFNAMVTPPGKIITLLENRRFDITTGIGFITNHLRDNNSFPRRKFENFQYVKKSAVFSQKYHNENTHEVILCGMNKTRKLLNGMVRIARGFHSPTAEVGETIICLRNSLLANGTKINNGDRFTVEGVIPGHQFSTYFLLSETGNKTTVNILNETWDTEKAPMVIGDQAMQNFTFGYAMSVHKAQGSTFEDVLFVDEDVSFFLDQQKFRYTGCSRAASMLWAAI